MENCESFRGFGYIYIYIGVITFTYLWFVSNLTYSPMVSFLTLYLPVIHFVYAP